MSAETDQFLPAFLSVQGQLSPIKKSMKAHKHKYANIDAVLEEVIPILQENKIVVYEPPVSTVEGKQFLQIILQHISGQFVATTMSLFHQGDMQSYGGSITYARRYAIVSLLGLPQEDDDGSSTVVSQKDTPVRITRDQYDHLLTLIKRSEDPSSFAKTIMNETKKPLDQLSEKQYYWLLNKYFKASEAP
jgi:hypothetical protein